VSYQKARLRPRVRLRDRRETDARGGPCIKGSPSPCRPGRPPSKHNITSNYKPSLGLRTGLEYKIERSYQSRIVYELSFQQLKSHVRIIMISTAASPSTSTCLQHTAIVSTIHFLCLVAIAWHMGPSLYLADGNQGPSPLATVFPSESPAISKTPPALKDENASIGTSPTPANDNTAQRQIQPRSGVLVVSLHEAVGISLPEHYKQLLNVRNDQQGTEPGPNTVPPTRAFTSTVQVHISLRLTAACVRRVHPKDLQTKSMPFWISINRRCLSMPLLGR
jgi:hypothetical protein